MTTTTGTVPTGDSSSDLRPVSSGLVEVAPGVQLYHEVFTPPGGAGGAEEPETVVLVMGLATQLVGWPVGFVAEFVERGYRVVRFDNRDIGLSSQTQGEPPDPVRLFARAAVGLDVTDRVPYTLADLADDTVGLLDHLGIGAAHLVGASMGGMIVQQLAIDHPERLLSATSIMSSTGSRRVGRAKARAARLLLSKPPTGREAVLAAALETWEVLSGPLFDPEAVLERTALAYDRSYRPAAPAFQLAAILASGNRTKALREVDVPFLVIHGRADPLIALSGGVATAKAIPDADLLVLDAMGHDLPRPLWPQIVGAITARIERARTERARTE